MSSQNVLLGSGVQPDEEKSLPPIYKKAPAWRFHKDFPNRLCKTDEELDKLDAEGWVDQPGKARLLPGHEKVWEAQKKLEAGKTQEVKEEVVAELVKSEDQIKADILKAESDKVEAKRIEAERKAEEKRLTEYEAAKNPPGPRLCTLCGKEFASLKALNMHGIGAHRNKK